MNKDAVKDIMYGGINELLHNPMFYTHSIIGTGYCHFTKDGEQALHEFTKQLAIMIYKAEEVALNRRAKDIVLQGLKGEQV